MTRINSLRNDILRSRMTFMDIGDKNKKWPMDKHISSVEDYGHLMDETESLI